jgi:phosphatidate cytidylyltransferase
MFRWHLRREAPVPSATLGVAWTVQLAREMKSYDQTSDLPPVPPVEPEPRAVSTKRSHRNLLTRVASAAVLLPLLLWPLHRGGLWSAALFGAAAGLAAHEFYRLVFQRIGFEAALGVAIAVLLPALPALAPGAPVHAALVVLAGASMLIWSYHLFRCEIAKAPVHAAHVLSGLFFCAVGLFALSLLREGPDGRRWVWCVLLATWSNDALAYFAGRAVGRIKLAPRISPGKTWEGAIAGAVASLGSILLARSTFFPALSIGDALVLGGVTAILGPVGDLCKSLLKRSAGVKESGRLIPGHGGMLDRIDALLFNTPAVLLYVGWLRA